MSSEETVDVGDEISYGGEEAAGVDGDAVRGAGVAVDLHVEGLVEVGERRDEIWAGEAQEVNTLDAR